MSRMWRSIGAGAVGGLVAAFAMNRYQSLVSAITKAVSGVPAQNQDEDATLKTAQAISRIAFDHELTEREANCAVPAVHYSLGIGLGIAYGLLAEKIPASTTGMGTAYGAAIWLGADEIAVPVLGFAYGPAQTSFTSHLNALGGHLVFGLVAGLTRKLLLRTT